MYDTSKDTSFATAYQENQKIMKSDLIKNCYISNGKTFSETKAVIGLIKQKSSHSAMINSIKTEITDKLGWTSKEFADEAEFDKYIQAPSYT